MMNAARIADFATAHDNTVQFPTTATATPATITLTPDQLQQIISSAVTAAIAQATTPATAPNATRPRPKKSRSRTATPAVVTLSPVKSNGVKKASAADPIRDPADFRKLADYLLHNGQAQYRVRNYTLAILGAALGLRCGDLLRLNYLDVFTEDGAVKTHVTLIEQKTRKTNKCKIPAMAISALELYKDEYDPDFSLNYPLFFSKRSAAKPIDITAAWRILNNAGTACGLDAHVSTHTLRKSYGFAGHAQGVRNGTAGHTLELLQAKYNHSDQRISMRYAGVTSDELDALSESVSEYFADLPTA